MFSYQVSGLVEFEQCLLRWVERFGAEVASPHELTFDFAVSADAGLPEVVFVPSFTLLFAAGTTLTVRLIVELDEGGTPEAVQYSFHFQAARRSWRYCRNPHHVEEDGSECHLHLPDGRRQPLKGPVSFEQIYEMVTVENAAQAGEQRRVDAGEASMDRMRSS